jgi:hypothetical protein
MKRRLLPDENAAVFLMRRKRTMSGYLLAHSQFLAGSMDADGRLAPAHRIAPNKAYARATRGMSACRLRLL